MSLPLPKWGTMRSEAGRLAAAWGDCQFLVETEKSEKSTTLHWQKSIGKEPNSTSESFLEIIRELRWQGTKTGCVLDHKANLTKFKGVEVTQSTYPNHSRSKLTLWKRDPNQSLTRKLRTPSWEESSVGFSPGLKACAARACEAKAFRFTCS